VVGRRGADCGGRPAAEIAGEELLHVRVLCGNGDRHPPGFSPASSARSAPGPISEIRAANPDGRLANDRRPKNQTKETAVANPLWPSMTLRTLVMNFCRSESGGKEESVFCGARDRSCEGAPIAAGSGRRRRDGSWRIPGTGEAMGQKAVNIRANRACPDFYADFVQRDIFCSSIGLCTVGVGRRRPAVGRACKLSRLLLCRHPRLLPVAE